MNLRYAQDHQADISFVAADANVGVNTLVLYASKDNTCVGKAVMDRTGVL